MLIDMVYSPAYIRLIDATRTVSQFLALSFEAGDCNACWIYFNGLILT